MLPVRSPRSSPDKRTLESSGPPSEASETPSKRQKGQAEQETPTKQTAQPLHATPQTPTKPTDPPLHTPRTRSRYNLDSATTTGIVRRSNSLGNILSLIEFFLQAFLEETEVPTAEEIGVLLTKYWQENVTSLFIP